MRKGFFKRAAVLLLCGCMAVSSVFVLSSCADDAPELDDSQSAMPEVVYDPYDYAEDDSKFALSLTGVATFVTGKIMEKAKSTALGYVEEVGNKIWTKATDWLKNSLLYCLGIEPTPAVPQHTINEVYDQVTAINSEIALLKDEVEQLQQQNMSGQYVTKYTAFMNTYNDLVGRIEVPSAALEQINLMRSDDFAGDAQAQSDYIAAANSLEGNIRGTGNMATPINQQTALSQQVIRLGTSMIGNSGITDVDKDGIFSVVRYFAEVQTPWLHQRKAIEDNYLATLIYTYQLAHSLVLFDLTYQMQQYDIGGVYTAADDGTILAFQYPAEDGEWYYNAYPYMETELKNKYASEFAAFEEDDAPVAVRSLTPEMTGSDGDYSDLYYLFGYYAQHVAQYNTIMVMFNNYTREDVSDAFVLQKAANGDGTYTEQRFPKYLTNLQPGDFLSVENNDVVFDFDKFVTTSKKSFQEFIDFINPYAKNGNRDLSLMEYLKYVGFTVPESQTNMNLLILGASNQGFWYKDGNNEYINAFYLYGVDMDKKVSELASADDPFEWMRGSMMQKWYGSCNNKLRKAETITLQSYSDKETHHMYAPFGRYYMKSDGTWTADYMNSNGGPLLINMSGLGERALKGTMKRESVPATW